MSDMGGELTDDRWRCPPAPWVSRAAHPLAQVHAFVALQLQVLLQVQPDAQEQFSAQVQPAASFVSMVMFRSSCVNGVMLR
jgi:hypothetical protein